MHRFIYNALLAMMVISFLSTGKAAGQNDQALTTEKALLTVIEQIVVAQQNFDSAALDKLLTADYLEVSPVGEVDEREKVLTFYAPSAKGNSPAATITVTEPHYRIQSETALVIVRENVQVKVGDKSREMALRVSFSLRKENSKWLIASAQYTGIR
jgi:hypothetical protein